MPWSHLYPRDGQVVAGRIAMLEQDMRDKTCPFSFRGFIQASYQHLVSPATLDV
jgi:hypothetical protein